MQLILPYKCPFKLLFGLEHSGCHSFVTLTSQKSLGGFNLSLGQSLARCWQPCSHLLHLTLLSQTFAHYCVRHRTSFYGKSKLLSVFPIPLILSSPDIATILFSFSFMFLCSTFCHPSCFVHAYCFLVLQYSTCMFTTRQSFIIIENYFNFFVL